MRVKSDTRDPLFASVMPEESIAKRILLIRTSYKTELDCWYQPSGESLHLHLRNVIAEEFNLINVNQAFLVETSLLSV